MKMKLPVHINNITDSKSTVEELSSQLIGIVNSSKINNAIPLDILLTSKNNNGLSSNLNIKIEILDKVI